MILMVDVKLRASTVLIVQNVLNEDIRSNTKCDGSEEGRSETTIIKKMDLFYKVIKGIVEERIKKLAASELQNLVLTSQDFYAEGDGSIEICEPPTEAQTRILKSLITVIFHQISGRGLIKGISEGHGNLIFSLFILKISCDVFLENMTAIEYSGSQFCDLKNVIGEIFNRKASDSPAKLKKLSSVEWDKIRIHLFCCLEDLKTGDDNKLLIDDFDKIDLYDDTACDEEDNEDIIGSSALTNSTLTSLGVSRQTQSLTNFTLLPSNELENLWESLYFDEDVKQKMFSYATIALKIASLSQGKMRNRECSIFPNNKLLIVHGPPGTGKTTICKALAQKLSIRKDFQNNMSPINTNHKGMLIEISCSKIFSRWFGESSKNLNYIFTDVENLLKANENTNSFICLLIDEVEVITFSRNDLLNRSESTDGVRVVSTLLTQLDQLKKYNNLLILATSNLLDSLDPAFIDRADASFYIGNPSREGIRKIISSSILELVRRDVILCHNACNTYLNERYGDALALIATRCLTLEISGRALRKLPLVCISEYIQVLPVPIEKFLIALALSVSDKSLDYHV